MMSTDIPLLLCINCRQDVSYIQLIKNNKEITIKSKCSCFKGDKLFSLESYMKKLQYFTKKPHNFYCYSNEHNKKGIKYCLDCSQWQCQECFNNHVLTKDNNNHQFIDYHIKIQCSKHKRDHQYHCLECHLSLCSECKIAHNTHPTHQLIDLIIPSISPIEDFLRRIDVIKEQNIKIKDDLIKRIRDECSVLEMNDYIQKVNNTFEDNQLINDLLKTLITYYIQTIKTFQSHPNYALMKFNELILFNYQDFIQYDSQLDIKKLHRLFIDHFAHSYILIINQQHDKIIQKTIKPVTLVKPNDKTNYKCKTSIEAHFNPITCIIQLHNKVIATASQDSMIKLWDHQTYDLIATLEGHIWSITCIIELQDYTLASGSLDKQVKIWNVQTFKCVNTLYYFYGHKCNDMISSLLQLSSGLIAVGDHDGIIKLWDNKTLQCVSVIAGNYRTICYSLLELSNERLAYGLSCAVISVWNIKTCCFINNLFGHQWIISCLLEVSDDVLISSEWGGLIKIWSLITFQCTTTVKMDQGKITGLIRMNNDDNIIAFSQGTNILLWNYITRRLIEKIQTKSLVDCIYKLDNNTIVSGTNDSLLKFWSNVN